jgi:hypothetical protein
LCQQAAADGESQAKRIPEKGAARHDRLVHRKLRVSWVGGDAILPKNEYFRIHRTLHELLFLRHATSCRA